MRKRFRKWLTRTAVAGGLVVLLALISLATGPGQRTALKLAAFMSSSAASGVSIGTLEGGLFSSGRIDSVALTDRDGAWFELRNVAFSWRPFTLLSGRLHIDSLTVETVDFARIPASDEANQSKSGRSSDIPLIGLVLARFEIAEINIAEAVAGEPLRLDAQADAHLVDPAVGLSANLAVKRLDGPGGAGTLHLAYRPDTKTLDLKVKGSAPGDGIVAKWLDLGGASLDLVVDGNGPLSAWRASWSLAASGTPFAAGNAAIDEQETGHLITAAFEGYLTPLVPQSAAPLLTGRTAGTFEGRWSDGRLEVERTAITNDAVDLRASGGIDTTSNEAFGDLVARIGRADGERLTFPVEGGEALAFGTAEIKLSAPRSATARNVSAEITSSGLSHGARSLDHLTLRAWAVQPQTAALRFESIDARIGATGLRRGGEDEPLDLDLAVTGSAGTDGLNLAFATDGLTGSLAGTLTPDAIALDLTARLADLARLVPQMTGAIALESRIAGVPGDLEVTASLTGENTTLHGHPVENATAKFTGRNARDAFSGALDARADVAGQQLTAAGNIASPANGAVMLDNLALSLGAIRIDGSLAMGAGALPNGLLKVDAPSLAALGAIVGQPVEGALNASIALTDAPGEPALSFHADASAIRYGATRLNTLRGEGRFDDVANGIHGQAELTIASVTGSVDAKDVRLTARGHGDTVEIGLKGAATGATFDLGATLVETDGGRNVTIAKATLHKGSLKAALAEPGRIAIKGETVHIEKLALAVGSGRIDIGGTASADKLAIDTRITGLPANLADTFVPDIGLGGTVDGRIAIAGTPNTPQATANATWRQASAAASRTALPPLTVDVTAKLAGDRVEGEVSAKGPDSLIVTTRGTLDFSPNGKLNATLSGDIPLAIANASLASRATRLSGRAHLSGNVTGSLDAPSLVAVLDIAGATARDPESGLSLKPVAARIRLTERGAVIERIEAASERGGTLSGSGEISFIDGGAPPMLRLAVNVSRLRFDDTRLMAGELDGRFEVRGTPSDLAASGAINLTRLDVTVPNAMPRSISTLDIRHVNAPDHIAAQQQTDEKRRERPSGGDTIALDIHLDAANRIFVQGRGLDVQLGGALTIGGSAAHPVANGAFAMERGRLSILGRELAFRRGNIRFYGSLEPLLDMEATAAAGDVTVVVTVSGSSADPKFTFSSVPALPEDEVVARLLYNKDLAGLSPLQLAQLASEIDKIGGLSSGPGMLDKLKASVGIDVLDFGTDSQGDTTVSAGSYVSESTFVGVKQGTGASSSQVVIDHELTKHLKARGELSADGKSKVGVGFEWDY